MMKREKFVNAGNPSDNLHWKKVQHALEEPKAILCFESSGFKGWNFNPLRTPGQPINYLVKLQQINYRSNK